jgi:hypothetical protein
MTARLALASLTLLLTGWVTGHTEELRPGVWAGGDLDALPVPASGYQVYLMGELVRVHLVDIDTPATAIRQHLLAIKEQVPGAATVRIPDAKDIKKRGLKAVDDLGKLTDSARPLAELRTVRYSVLACQQGLKDGGPKRDRGFSPLALRLKESGVSVFSVVIFPLSGRMSWRGYEGELPYTASDGNLADGETLDRVLAAAPGATFLYVDPKRQKIRLPSQDITAYVVDAFLLPASATAMEDRCVAP